MKFVKMENQNIKNIELKKKWNSAEEHGIPVMINKAFENDFGISNAKDYLSLTSNEFRGYPALFAHKEFQLEKDIKLNAFIFTETGALIAIGEDSEENDVLYKLN